MFLDAGVVVFLLSFNSEFDGLFDGIEQLAKERVLSGSEP